MNEFAAFLHKIDNEIHARHCALHGGELCQLSTTVTVELYRRVRRLVEKYDMPLPTILEAGIALLEELEYDACVAAAEAWENDDG